MSHNRLNTDTSERPAQLKLAWQDMEIFCEIGIHDFEKIKPQRLFVSIALELAQIPVKIGAKLSTERKTPLPLTELWLRQGLQALVHGRRYNLQESLCEAIVTYCFSDPSVLKAVVQTCKPDVYPDCERVCCQLTATRKGQSS